MELAEIVMNPVRQRIFQYLLLHETGTVKEIRKALPDVPGASLYRHMKLLTESGILTVVGENRIRSTVESIYSLNKSALEIDDDGTVVQTALLGLSASFARYFSGGGADPRRDMLLMTTCTLTLTDEEFTGFLTEINQTALKYMDIGVKEGSAADHADLFPHRRAGEPVKREKGRTIMVIALFGDSCTGKSTIAAALAPSLSAEVFSGKDYLKLAKSESMAAALFQKKLRGEETILYVISEKDQLALLPEGCVRVLVTAGLATIKERFAARMHGNLPAPVAAMLERKYGRFETEAHDLRVDTDAVSAEEAANEIRLLLNRGERDAQN